MPNANETLKTGKLNIGKTKKPGVILSENKLYFDIKDRGRNKIENKLTGEQVAFYEQSRRTIGQQATAFWSHLWKTVENDPNAKMPIVYFDVRTRQSVTQTFPLKEVMSTIDKQMFFKLLQHLPEQECGYGYRTKKRAGSYGLYQFEIPTWKECQARYARRVPVLKQSRINDDTSQVRVALMELMGYLYRFNNCYTAAIYAWNAGPYSAIPYTMGALKKAGKSEEEILRKTVPRFKKKEQAEYVNNVLYRIGLAKDDLVEGLYKPKFDTTRRRSTSVRTDELTT